MRRRTTTAQRSRRVPKRRNPIARLLRDPAFRARAAANRRKYTRKPKHKPDIEPDPD